MAARQDLWGALDLEQVRTPVSILREQAALLGDKTHHLVEAEVSTSTQPDWAGPPFMHHFRLVVPALENYRYELFRIGHRIQLYPVTAYSDAEVVLEAEESLIEWLRQKLTSPETKRLISSLMAQARG